MRIDGSAYLLVKHPEVISGFPAGVGFLEALEDHFEMETEDYRFHPLLIDGVKSLNIAVDTWLLWWNDNFIGQYEANYYLDTNVGCIEFSDADFWNDLLIITKPVDPLTAYDVMDMKITAEKRFVDFLKADPDQYTQYIAIYKRPEDYEE